MANTAASRNDRAGHDRAAVDVIIPVFGGEAFIGETVQSVLRQTHRNVKVLCLVDGTKVRSGPVIESPGDPRVTVLERDNRSANGLRNEGLARTDGECLLFLNPGDVLYPDCIESALAVMRERDAAAVAFGGHLIDAEGRIIRRMYRWFPPKLTLERLVRGNALFTTGQMLVRRSAMRAVGGFDEGAGSAADWELWIKFAKRGLPMAFVNRCLMGCRFQGGIDPEDASAMLAGERYILRHTLHMFGDPDKLESRALMRYAARTGDFAALGRALAQSPGLMMLPRFAQAALQTAIRAARRRRRNGSAGSPAAGP
jgi:glycosyltransferase involved in cell wall biosynthesis